MLKNFLFFIVSSVAISFNSIGQDSLQNKRVWTLEECIIHASKNNIDIRRSQLALDGSEVNYTQSKSAFFPSVNASASHYFNYGRSIDRATNQFVNAQTQNGGVNLDGSLTVFNGLRNQHTLRQYKNLFQAELANLEQVKNNVSINVATFYLTILQNNELLEAAKLQLQNSVEQVNRTEKLVNAGALPEANLLEVKAQMSTEELNVVNAENQLELSKLDLLQALLLPANTEFEIVIPNIENFDISPVALSSQDIFEIALNTQPGIKSAEYSIIGARFGEMAAKGNRYPSLVLGAGVGTNYSSQFRDQFSMSYETQLRQNRGEYVGVSLSIPIFNNFQVRSSVQNAIINRKRAELNEIETKNNLRQSVEQAYQNAKSGEKRYRASVNQVAALRESFRVNEQRFNLGAINSLDYTLAKNNLNRAESDLIRAKYDYLFRLKILDFYQDKPLTLTTD